MKYHHLAAEVNGMIKDVLVSDVEMMEQSCDHSAFFVPGAENISYQGMVELLTESDLHVLPEVFG